MVQFVFFMDFADEYSGIWRLRVGLRACELFHEPGSDFTAIGESPVCKSYWLVKFRSAAFSRELLDYFPVLSRAATGGTGGNFAAPNLPQIIVDFSGDSTIQGSDSWVRWCSGAQEITLPDEPL